ncbi:IST1-LIKE 6 [Hibiscus trionum]|uniref:IST1-LIKE 6 n=1 Tax=Hibiscus trionum TaxID=183268 RepID=A0A9W7HDM8_HIBTR|nr:IST1-LIKE 6 [Hibiscus trionum]
MGKKLDALLGRGFKPSKFKSVISVAISRLSVFKNQRQARCNLARSDVVQLLQLGHHDRALLRVEQVVKEQNMLDVFGILEGYCNLLIERVRLIEQERDCPDELKEAMSGLLFASSRCGDFPELQEIRAIFVSRYGKEFAARAIELRNNCGVNTMIIQKLSTRQPDLQSRRNALNEIAAENGIALQLHKTSVSATDENLDGAKNHSQLKLDTLGKATNHAGLGDDYGISYSPKARKKYKDVADAAQAAFKSAAHAAAAARAAVELSRSDFHDPEDHNSPDHQRKRVFDIHEPSSKGKETHQGSQAEELNQSTKTPGINISSPSSNESSEGNLGIRTMSLDEVDPIKLLEKEVVIHESDDDNHDFYGSSFDTNTRKLKGKDNEHSENTGLMFQNSSDKQVPTTASLRAGLKLETGPENPSEHASRSTGTKGKRPFTTNKWSFSVY